MQLVIHFVEGVVICFVYLVFVFKRHMPHVIVRLGELVNLFLGVFGSVFGKRVEFVYDFILLF